MSDLLQQYQDAFNLLESGTTVLYRLQRASLDGGKVIFPYMVYYLNLLLYYINNPGCVY